MPSSYMQAAAEGSGVDGGKTKLYQAGSSRNWMDDLVRPEDAMQDIEVDADIFYDYFLSIPFIKSTRRFKDQKEEWYAKLEVIASAIPNGLEWVETENPETNILSRIENWKWTEIQNTGLAKALNALHGKKNQAIFSKQQWNSFQDENLIDLSIRGSFIQAGSRFFTPAASEGVNAAIEFLDVVWKRGGDEAVHKICKGAAHYKRSTEADSTVTLLATQNKFGLYCANFHKEMPKYIPKKKKKMSKESTSTNMFVTDPFEKTQEIFKPDPFDNTQAMFNEFFKNGKFQDHTQTWALTDEDCKNLREAWELDRPTKNASPGFSCSACITSCLACIFYRERADTKLLREIHEDALQFQTKVAKKSLKKASEEFKMSIQQKFSFFGFVDATFLKFWYATLVNLVVIFLIIAIMNTIGSGGLPGRQQLDDKTSFKVILKVKDGVSNTDRFDKPEQIFDVCQGLGWWMQDDRFFKSETYNWPIGKTSSWLAKGSPEGRSANPLSDLAKKHWDPLLNSDDTCPNILGGLARKLEVTYFDDPTLGKNMNCYGAQPESPTWTGDYETQEYFLFQDQGVENYNGGYEVLQTKGVVLTDLSGISKEFTQMSGNFNGKVQQLQPIDPLDPVSSGGQKALFQATSSTWDYEPFWKALDRIWPSEWAVQALFSLNVNSNVNGNSQYDENQIVGGYNSFGRRPTAIVQANVGGGIGGINGNGNMIEEAIWQFLERRCWHKDKFSTRQPLSLTTTPMTKIRQYSPKSQYAKDYNFKDGKPIMWADLDQGLRDYWRGLGLGVDDTKKCQDEQLPMSLVTSNSQCISGKTKCTRVNYHSVQRWNAYNDESIAEKNFNARNFTSIFFSYECEGQADGSSPSPVARTWDKIELAEDVGGKLLAAAANLGYDSDEWKSHSKDPTRTSGPPDNLVLDLENYLEGEAYFSTFFWTQVICSLIMICVSMPEIRNMIMWAAILPPSTGPKTSLDPRSWYEWGRWFCNDMKKSAADVMRTVFIRWASMFLALGSYVVIPVLLVMVSILLILESGSVLDVIKDTLSLLFLNEINNYLQVRNAPDGAKWTIRFTTKQVSSVTRRKNLFSWLLVVMFTVLSIVTTRVVYTGSAGNAWGGSTWRVHPSILFNLARFRSFYDGFISWAVFVVILGMIWFVWEITKIIVSVLDFCETKEKWAFQKRLTNFAAYLFDDANAYDDDDWDAVVPFQELAQEYDIQQQEEIDEIEDEKRQKAEREAEEAAEAAEAARLAALSASRPPPPQSAPAPPQSASLLRGVWKSQYLNGQMMEVLIHEDNGKVMASRLPGDTSGTVRWFLDTTALDTTASTASLVVNSSRPSGMPTSAPSPMFQSTQVHQA